MYFETTDFMTVWKLGLHWTGRDGQDHKADNLPDDLKVALYRVLHGVIREELSVRNHKGLLFDDKSTIGQLLEVKHTLRIGRCIRKGIFDIDYLETLYLKRSEFLRWCEREYLSPPKIWAIAKSEDVSNENYDDSEDENDGWYNELTERRKERVACLELAKKLWEINPNLSYEQVFNHDVMKQYGKPKVFSLEAFKKWARPFASEYAKRGGRPK